MTVEVPHVLNIEKSANVLVFKNIEVLQLTQIPTSVKAPQTQTSATSPSATTTITTTTLLSSNMTYAGTPNGKSPG